MRRSFLHAKKRAPGSFLFFLLLSGAFIAFAIWVFVSIDPFQTVNPFLREVTIGQSVIGDWRYGGADASGSMKFYDAYQYITIPGNSPTFAADGEFVSIEGHSPSTLTFEPPYESEVLGPASYIWILFVLAAVSVLVWKKKRVAPLRIRRQRKNYPRLRRRM